MPGQVLRRALAGVSLVATAGTVLLAIAFVVATARERPIDTVEAQLYFGAARLREGLPLFVDPVVGARDYAVPAHYYALYTPTWMALLALFPAGADRAVGRILAGLAWFAALGIASWSPHPEPPCRTHGDIPLPSVGERRRIAAAAALAAGGVFFLVRGAVGARPDSVAVLLAGAALVRASSRRACDAWCAVLLAAAVFFKPNVCGIAVGLVVADLGVRRRAAVRSTMFLALLVLSGMAALQWWSGGAWWTHLVRSTMYPMRFERWVEQVGTRLHFLGAPHFVALFIAWRARREVPHALLALGTSLALAIASMAKSGSATNYWLEPTVAAIVVLASAPLPATWRPGSTLAHVGWAGVSVLIFATGAAPLLEWWGSVRPLRAWIVEARRACNLAKDEAVIASESGLEFELGDRVVVPPYETTNLVRQGRFPLEVWSNAVADPRVACYASWGESLDVPTPAPGEARFETSAYGVELKAQLQRDFVRTANVGPFVIYRRRAAMPTTP